MSQWKRLLQYLTAASVLFVLAGCGEEGITALDPQGPQAQWLYDNMLLSLYVMAFVIIVVFVLFFIIVAKFRRKPGDDEIPEQVEGSKTLELTWTIIPIFLLAILAVPTVTGTFILADTDPDPEGSEFTSGSGSSGEEELDEDEVAEDGVTIEVTGHQYWWQFDYEEGFTAGQEVYIPAGEKVEFELHASDVMHSFWVPALGGKVDTIPGITNYLWLEADEPGVYQGKCAELCGPSHALMEFQLIALERDEYDAWVEEMSEDPEEIQDTGEAERGHEVFEEQGCIGCHAIGGSGSAAGPTLTNFGDREAFAGILEATDENLEEWIRDPESIKQDNDMPAYPEESINDEDMDALIEYLQSLTILEDE
ncbi:cytochrome c oxidase subunit 2 [Salsuginibacillus halophilus]|uniref:Cytochrome c oxidase subunit 2 n=1 Tax=Salsuginibacillus halophilus TaxID=517424 RepID=A0A2P8HX93_9BACI|nr:cytochrome c oxidase subunit II [Salsuginibacillus halophilus]PSL50827.1 cytochrome c oxidase subunit 2 [Salsuginibacillus halophilus]